MLKADIIKQASRYNTIIESSVDGILLLDAVRNDRNEIIDFTISSCNQTGRKLARFPEDAMGKNLLQILPHLVGGKQFRLHKKVVETGKEVQFETTFRDKDGKEYGWFIVLLQKLDDGVLSRFVDISEKKNDKDKIEKQAGLLKSILDASQHGVVALKAVKDQQNKIIDFTILDINDRFASFLNLKREDIIGKRYLGLFKYASQKVLFNLKCKAILTGHSMEQEIFFNENGAARWLNISIAPLGLDGVVQTVFDITDSKTDKDRLSKIINTSQAGIFTLQPVVSPDGQMEDFVVGLVNKSAETFFGILQSKVKGLLVSKQLSFFTTNGLFEYCKDTFITGNPNTIEFHYQQKKDLYFDVRTDKMGNEILVTFTDQTQLKQLQFNLQKSNAELQRSNESLEEFSYAASHDLKEPIRKINMLLSHFRVRHGKRFEEDAANIFDKLEESTRRMILLVDDLLSYSHLQYEDTVWEEIKLQDLTTTVVNDLDLIIEAKKAVINVNSLPVITGHKRQMQQLFQNLLINALKYSKPDQPPEISISSTKLKGTELGFDMPESMQDALFYVVEMSDKGIGFEQKYAEKIFNIFERLHRNSHYKGSGVGLALARRIVENHKGYIKAFSEPGKGATFKIYLPTVVEDDE